MQVQETSYGKSHEPESHYGGTDGHHELACATITGVCGPSTANAEDLSKDANKKNYAAENKGKPSHG
jgi:hypothetical protein